ncbi:alcohol dehydrogenase catalytic domain-containing protein [Frigoribacterium sp. 2-23]|uniref:alcohol dehydrogenase catalytic domain-containing protein n=1 Tax=Frigoribacterium sp. 2-23 TaxID=3415006 RepID=UPI003C6ED388
MSTPIATPTTVPGHDHFLPQAATAMVWPGPGRRFEAVAVPAVRLERGDVIVRIELASICPSDLRAIAGDGTVAAPGVLGHEAVGRIVAADQHARTSGGARLLPGMRVVWSTTVSCGRCTFCHRGLPQRCTAAARYGRERMRRHWDLSGAFATHVHVRRGSGVVVVGDDVPAAALAPVACAGATAWAAVSRAQTIWGAPIAGEVVLVAGSGAAALTAVALAVEAGARPVVLAATEDGRRRALLFGAVAVADPTALSGPLSLPRVLAAVDRGGLHRTIGLDFSGRADRIARLAASVVDGGVLVLASVSTSAPASVPPGHGHGHGSSLDASLPIGTDRLVRSAITVAGVTGTDPCALENAVGFVTETWHRYPFGELVGATYPLDRLEEALAAAGADTAPPRVGIVPE